MTEEQVERPAYLIRKGGAYYRANSQGYTTSALLAGRYTLAAAKGITHPNGPDGPRDGMRYIHEDAVTDENWLFHRASTQPTPQEAAKVLSDARKRIEAVREMYCLASPGSDEEFAAVIFGIDMALRAIAGEDKA